MQVRCVKWSTEFSHVSGDQISFIPGQVKRFEWHVWAQGVGHLQLEMAAGGVGEVLAGENGT